MSKYIFKLTYTPDDPDCDRKRHGVVVETDKGVLDMLVLAFSTLEMSGLCEDVTKAYLEDIGDEDTSEGWMWTYRSNNGDYDLEWATFDAEDPVTKDSFLAWARREAGPMIGEDGTDEELQHHLCCIMGRWYWRNIDQWSSHDLKEQLHEFAVLGGKSKPYDSMTILELVETIFEEVMEFAQDQYDEGRKGVPFGIKTMVADDEDLWLDR
jgi:hypothetical protein